MGAALQHQRGVVGQGIAVGSFGCGTVMWSSPVGCNGQGTVTQMGQRAAARAQLRAWLRVVLCCSSINHYLRER